MAPPRRAVPDRAPGSSLWRSCLLVASLVAGLLTVAGWHGAIDGLLLGLSLTVLPIVLLAGSVLWEGVPVRTAATHGLDWLIKLVAIGAIVGAFA